MNTIKRVSKVQKSEKAKLRVELAKDVLKQLKLKKLVAESTYFSLEEDLPDPAVSFKTAFHDGTIKKCEVCARGALMVSWVNKFNQYSVDEMFSRMGDSRPLDEITKLFGPRNTYLIEEVFEKYWTIKDAKEALADSSQIKNKKEKAILSFYKGCRTREQLLGRIMKNIIKNNGLFVLP